MLEPFLKSGFHFGILQASGNLEEIDTLHSCVIGVAYNEGPSFRKIMKDYQCLEPYFHQNLLVF